MHEYSCTCDSCTSDSCTCVLMIRTPFQISPDPWPKCIDRLDCPSPSLDDDVMTSDWESGAPLTPEFSVTYTCKWPDKKMISKKDLEAGIDEDLQDALTIHCQLNGTYDIDISDWTCTKPCPFPSLPDPLIMSHDWSDNETKPEIYQEVRHTCLHAGRHLVSKKFFETGEETNLLDDIMSSCQVTGWLNETIGSYTCTQGCDAPLNHSDVFDHDWMAGDSSDIGTIVT